MQNHNCNLANVEIKYYNIMTDGKNFFDQPIKNNKVTYENIRKLLPVKEATAQLGVC